MLNIPYEPENNFPRVVTWNGMYSTSFKPKNKILQNLVKF